jgi:NADH-quinone oxidoreductase subunit L
VTHAFFKGCLFLGAGSVMHGMGDETDIRKMGGLFKKMPHTALTFLIATIAATGIVPLSGFWSKDAILGGALFSHNPAWHQVGPIAYVIGALAALGTAFYMTRLYWLTFFGKPRTHAAEHAHESSPVMTLPLWVLSILSVVALVLGLPGHGPLAHVFERYMSPVFQAGTAALLRAEHFHEGAHPSWPYFAAWAIAAAGTLVAVVMYRRAFEGAPTRLALALPRTYRFTLDKFRVDELYDAVVLRPIKWLAWALWRVVDVFLIDGLFVNGAARTAGVFGRLIRVAQNGDVQRYAAVMAVAAALLLWAVLGVGGDSP